jgi:acid phosphatase
MQDDGHDTTVNVAANWTRTFLTPLLKDCGFTNKTLILITFDESETYTIKNNVWALLLGDVIPASLRGTTDNTFYTHYSALSTVQANWGLYNLGRGDVITNYSNVFEIVANVTNYKNIVVAEANIPYFNFTSGGYFDTSAEGPIPAVNPNVTGAGGRGILPSLKGANGSAIYPPPASPSASPSGTAAAKPSGSASAAIRLFTYSFEGIIGFVFALAAFSIGLVI